SLDAAYLDELDRRSSIEWGDSTRARHFLKVGRVVEQQVPSARYGRLRRVWVYTPLDYPKSGTTYDLLVAFDGRQYLEDISLPVILDTPQVSGRIRPTIAVLIDDATGTERLEDLGNRERFDRFLGDELVPWVRAHWRVTSDPRRVTVTGSSAGGLAAAHV